VQPVQHTLTRGVPHSIPLHTAHGGSCTSLIPMPGPYGTSGNAISAPSPGDWEASSRLRFSVSNALAHRGGDLGRANPSLCTAPRIRAPVHSRFWWAVRSGHRLAKQPVRCSGSARLGPITPS